jgi:hypothetical protein
MGRGTYNGGHTIISIGGDGTRWEGSGDPANPSRATDRRAKKRFNGDRNDESAAQYAEAAETARERKLLRNFISQCASAWLKGSLGPSIPTPPSSLRKKVRAAGGNIRWMEADRRLQVLFHQACCSLGNNKIPFEKVWGPRRR